MKLAICMSGHMRKFMETYPAFNTFLLRHHECDFFISTWDRMGYACPYRQDASLDVTEKYLDQINKTYQPKKIVVEPSAFVDDLKQSCNEYAPHLKDCPKHLGHMASMFYKIYASNELRKKYQLETGVEYDWVIRYRPDLFFHKTIVLPNEKIAGRIYLPQFQCKTGWYSDQFAIGLSDDMDLYSSFFFQMQEYFSNKGEYYPEKFMDWCLKQVKLLPVMWNLNFHILR